MRGLIIIFIVLIIFAGGFYFVFNILNSSNNNSNNQIANQENKPADNSNSEIKEENPDNSDNSDNPDNPDNPNNNNSEINKEINDNLQEVINKNSNLSKFNEALKNAKLSELISNEDNVFTIFIPSNDAILKSEVAFSNLSNPANINELEKTIKFHIIKGNLSANDIAKSSTLKSENENLELIISKDKNGILYIDGVEITTVDLKARNGTIHVIDNLLLPSNISL